MPIFNFGYSYSNIWNKHISNIRKQRGSFNVETPKPAEICTITQGMEKYKENECLLKI